MSTAKPAFKEAQKQENKLPKTVVELFKTLDEIEAHTTDIRKKILTEIREGKGASSVKLKLDNVQL